MKPLPGAPETIGSFGPGTIIKMEKEPWSFRIRASHIYSALVGAAIASSYCLLLMGKPSAYTTCEADKVKIVEFSGINTQFTCVPVDIFYERQSPKLKPKFKAKKRIKPRINKKLNRGLKPTTF